MKKILRKIFKKLALFFLLKWLATKANIDTNALALIMDLIDSL